MFTAVGSSKARTWLLSLLVLWAALLFGGFVFGNDREIPKPARLASSLVLVAAGWSWFALARDQHTRLFRLLVAIGMTLGFVGDLFMAESVMLGGIGAFGCGHLAYITAMVHFGNRNGLSAPGPRWGALAAWLLIGLLGWLTIVFPSSQSTELRWAALVYTLLLSSTAGCATGLAIQAPPFRLMALGTGLFLLSDMIIAAEQFGEVHRSWVGPAIWLTYGPAQMLIVYGGNAALGEVREYLEEKGARDDAFPLNLESRP
jgi:hypothetical protein